MQTRVLSRCLTLAAALLLSAALPACDDSEGPDDEPDIGQIRLTIGANSILSVNQQPPSGNIVIPRGTHAVAVTAMTAGGQTLSLNPSDFELRINSSNTAVIGYTKSGPFAGTINAAAAGTARLEVQLFHLREGHPDYAVTFNVTVQ